MFSTVEYKKEVKNCSSVCGGAPVLDSVTNTCWGIVTIQKESEANRNTLNKTIQDSLVGSRPSLIKLYLLTNPAPVQSTSCNVCLVFVFVPLQKPTSRWTGDFCLKGVLLILVCYHQKKIQFIKFLPFELFGVLVFVDVDFNLFQL